MNLPCIAKYLRVSLEDFDLRKRAEKDESNSIQNQRKLVEAYIENEPTLSKLPAVEFVDDGYTGTNFERPGFQKMFEGIKAGTISCVIVKDLSRFGRNYLEAGDYLEHIFPFLGVRFIAINDSYDSADNVGTNMGLDLAFKNILHDYYSKDLSAKVRSAQRSRMQAGKYVNVPPYGYQCDPADKHHLIPDPDTAPTVRHIFSQIIAGKSTSDLARELNAQGVPTPYEVKGNKRRSGMPTNGDLHWTHRTILNILGNYKYTGAMVNHTHENPSLRAKSQRRTTPEEWIVNEGMHEPIVSHTEFEQARHALRTVQKGERKTPDTHNCVYYCAHCGKRLRKTYGTTTYLSCETSTFLPDAPCKHIHWQMEELEQLVLTSFQIHLDHLLASAGAHKQAPTPTAEEYLSEMARLNAQIERCQKEKMDLYTAYKLGERTKEEYLQAKARQTQEAEQLNHRVDELRQEYEAFLEQKQAQDASVHELERFLPDRPLNREELLDLMYQGVDRVLVSGDKQIEIVWKYHDIFSPNQPSVAV